MRVRDLVRVLDIRDPESEIEIVLFVGRSVLSVELKALGYGPVDMNKPLVLNMYMGSIKELCYRNEETGEKENE